MYISLLLLSLLLLCSSIFGILQTENYTSTYQCTYFDYIYIYLHSKKCRAPRLFGMFRRFFCSAPFPKSHSKFQKIIHLPMYILILYIYTVYIYIYIIYITHVLCLVGWNPHIKSRCSSVSIDHRLFELFVSLFVSDGRDSVLLVLNEYSTSTQRVVLSRPIFIDKIHRTVLSRCPMLPCLPRNLLSLKCLSIQHFCPCMFGSGLKNKLESTRINWNSLHVQVISSCTTWRK